MELKEARYILAIAKHQSIGKAAESLYISQPSLSKYLKTWKNAWALPLFDRRENHYYPTYMGSAISTTQSALPPLGTSGARNLMTLPTRKRDA